MLTKKDAAATIALGAALVLFGFASLPIALAGKGGIPNGGGGQSGTTSGGGGSTSTTTLSLVSETVWKSLNPDAPSWCLNEDDYHKRTWSGSLNGSFTATEQLCGLATDYSGGLYWDAGGIGIQVDLYVAGSLNDFTITSPQGGSHHAVLVGSTTSNGGAMNHYQVCYMPPYALASDTGGVPLPGGTWQITLSGNVSKVSFSETAQMADVYFQQANCPLSEQNLVQ